MRIAIVFPGQGTQQPAMGTVWKGTPSWEAVERVADPLGIALQDLLIDGDASLLSATEHAQLAVLLNSMIAWHALATALVGPLVGAHESGALAVSESQNLIVGFAGHSLGQLSALIASGSMTLHDGVSFARTRARATQDAANISGGRMTALIGATPQQAQEACAPPDVAAWVANDNAPGQIVIAGTQPGLELAVARAKQLGVKRAMPLAVNGAFHTPLMEPALPALRRALDEIAFTPPTASVVSNHDALPYTDTYGWRDRLVTHPTQTVQWRETLLTLRDTLGAETLIEVGHGTMIAGVAKRTIGDTPVLRCSEPDDVALLVAALQGAGA